jgi:hypothetical protein
MNGYGGDNRSFAGDLDPDSYRVRIDINFTNRSASDVAGFSHQNGVNVGQRSCDKLGLEIYRELSECYVLGSGRRTG